MYRSTGIPVRKITVLPTAKIAPAMPPPTVIFDMLICGRALSSCILHLLTLRYHNLRFSPMLREASP
jgi:hypothetical protein